MVDERRQERDRGEREINCEDERERDITAASPRRLNAGRGRGQRVVGGVIETVNEGDEPGRSIGEKIRIYNKSGGDLSLIRKYQIEIKNKIFRYFDIAEIRLDFKYKLIVGKFGSIKMKKINN